MRKRLIIIIGAVVVCAVCYSVGYQSGVRRLSLKNQLQGDLLITLHTYQAAQSTNWVKVQSTLGTQLVALTRYYE